MEENPEVLKPIPQERVQNNTVEQIADVPISQIQEKMVGVIHLIQQERIYERIEGRYASRIQEELLEAIQLIRKARISGRIVETFMDMPVPQIQKRPVEGNTFNEYTNAVRTEETQNQSLQENTLYPSSEQCARSSAATWVRQTSKSETRVGSCSVSNVAFSETARCPATRPSLEEAMSSTPYSPSVRLRGPRRPRRPKKHDGMRGGNKMRGTVAQSSSILSSQWWMRCASATYRQVFPPGATHLRKEDDACGGILSETSPSTM